VERLGVRDPRDEGERQQRVAPPDNAVDRLRAAGRQPDPPKAGGHRHADEAHRLVGPRGLADDAERLHDEAADAECEEGPDERVVFERGVFPHNRPSRSR